MAELDVVSEPADDSFEAEEKKEERSGSMKRKATKPVQMMEGVEEEVGYYFIWKIMTLIHQYYDSWK